MRLYVLVSFWFGIAGFIVRILEMGVREWPATKKVSLGEHVGLTILGVAFTAWAAIVLWLVP